MENQPEKKTDSLIDILKRLLSLYIETIKLTSAEKITMLMAGVTLFAVLMVLIVLALIFIAIGLTNLLEAYIAPFWSYFIIAGILTLIIVLTVLLKKTLIYNPIARFISKLFLNPPEH